MLCSVTGEPPLPRGFGEFVPEEEPGQILKDLLLGKEQKRKEMARSTTRHKELEEGKQEVLSVLGSGDFIKMYQALGDSQIIFSE